MSTNCIVRGLADLRVESLPAALAVLVAGFIYNSSLALGPVVAQPSEAGPQKSGTAQYMGTGSCSSSNCHGSVAPRAGSNVLQNEYVTWQKYDHHAKAYEVLGNSDSRIIAKHLGIDNPQQDPLCLQCHSTYVPKAAQRAASFQVEDGISCEACHGAAERYLGPHAANDATNAKNVELGMKQLSNPSDANKLCLSCHFGDENRVVSHRLIGAGHPRLSFELDTFQSIMPRHWEVDDDYRQRKADYQPARAWLTGQALQSKELVARILSKKRSKLGMFPEFTMFYCYACHHDLTSEQWKTREYGGRPGEPTLNLASLLILRESLRTLQPATGDRLEKNIQTLHLAFRDGSPANALQELRKLVDEKIIPLTQKVELGASAKKQILRGLATYGAGETNMQYEVAEQITMAISSLAADLSPDGKLLKAEIDGLYQALRDPKTFVAEEFTAAANQLIAAASKI